MCYTANASCVRESERTNVFFLAKLVGCISYFGSLDMQMILAVTILFLQWSHMNFPRALVRP